MTDFMGIIWCNGRDGEKIMERINRILGRWRINGWRVTFEICTVRVISQLTGDIMCYNNGKKLVGGYYWNL